MAKRRKAATVNLVLRLPPDLHSKVAESARIRKRSLNSEILTLLEAGLADDWEMRLSGMPEHKWIDEIRAMHTANQARYEMLVSGLTRLQMEEDAARKKKGAA
jgi:hypothetical protein